MLFVPLFVLNACLIAGLGYFIFSLYDERSKSDRLSLERAQEIIRGEIELIRAQTPTMSEEKAALAALNPDRAAH